MPAFLTTGLALIDTFVPKLLLALVILTAGLIVAELISKALAKLLERVGFDRLVERGGIKKALATSKLDPSDIIAKLLHYTLVLFVLQFAFGVFGPNPVSTLLGTSIGFLPKVIVAIIIVIIAAAIATAVKTLIEGTLGGLSYGKVLAIAASIFVLFLGIIAALNQVEIAVTVTTPILIAILATVSGIAVVGVGGGADQADAGPVGDLPHQGRGGSTQGESRSAVRTLIDRAGQDRRRPCPFRTEPHLRATASPLTADALAAAARCSQSIRPQILSSCGQHLKSERDE